MRNPLYLVVAFAATSAAFVAPIPFPALGEGRAIVRAAGQHALSGIVLCDGPPPAPAPAPAPAALPKREIDSRGFVVPQVGDVVKMPSKWPGEWDVGQVDFVQFIGSRGAFEVDLLPLKSIGRDMYSLPGKKPSTVRYDIGKLGRLVTEYVPEQDAYRVNANDLEPLGGRKVEDPDITAQGLAEYAELKAGLLREAAILGAVGTLASKLVYGDDVSFAFGAGAAGGIAYLLLLQRETDSISNGEAMPRVLAALVGGRVGVPVVVFAALAARQLAASGGGPATLSILSKEQFGAAVLGFFAYKAPLFVRNIGKALQELSANEAAQAPLTAGAMPTGSLGMAVRLAQDRLKKKEAEGAAAAAAGGAAAAAASGAQLVVLCGPSGVGKSTLIARLLEDDPARFGFSVSCTTRPPRAGEVDGKDYTFLSDDRFDAMVEAGEFVEWANVGGQRYGTSVAGVQKVGDSGRVCLMDLDVQGVENLKRRADLRAFAVWIAPPSLDALRARLRGRGTEDSGEIEKRITRATQEIEFSLSARCFDKIVLNDDLDDAYDALTKALAERLS